MNRAYATRFAVLLVFMVMLCDTEEVAASSSALEVFKPSQQWHASVTVDESTLDATSSLGAPSGVFCFPPLFRQTSEQKAITEVVYEVGIKCVILNYSATFLSRTFHFRAKVSEVKLKLKLRESIAGSKKFVPSAFRVEKLGKMEASVEGLWFLDRVLDAVLCLLLFLGRSRLIRITQRVGFKVMAQKFR